MLKAIEKLVQEFRELAKEKITKIISHYDTDGITAAAILARALRRLDVPFSIKIVKQLDENYIKELERSIGSKDLLIFLDLGSSHVKLLSTFPCEVFIFDHHEIAETELEELMKSKKLRFVNPVLFGEESSAAGLAYLFSKALDERNKDSADLAVIGMVGDMQEQMLSKINTTILRDSNVIVKRSLLLFSASRPLYKALEFGSDFWIPGVTGNAAGSLMLLREASIENGKQRTLLDLSEKEISRLLTAIMLRKIYTKDAIIGNIYLVKFFSQLEDAREISAMINSSSRLGRSDVALDLCLGIPEAMTKTRQLYSSYKHEIIEALKFVSNDCEKIEGDGYVIIKAGNKIKDSIIGTVISILSTSFFWPHGTIIVGLAYQQSEKEQTKKDKKETQYIKISARISGRKSGINLSAILSEAAAAAGGEGGGHAQAAGGIIPFENEQLFIDAFKTQIENRK